MRKRSKKLIKQANISGKCQCDICHETEPLVTHHIRGRDIPNPEHPSNLTQVCSNCHYKIHLGRIVLEGWFKTTAGKELMWHFKEDKGFTGVEGKPYIINRESN